MKSNNDMVSKPQYVISCYTTNSALYHVPIRASTDWLKNVLERDDVIDGVPLTKSQFTLLKSRLDWRIEITWHSHYQYFVESVSKTRR